MGREGEGRVGEKGREGKEGRDRTGWVPPTFQMWLRDCSCQCGKDYNILLAENLKFDPLQLLNPSNNQQKLFYCKLAG
jgi:hypothetical protein